MNDKGIKKNLRELLSDSFPNSEIPIELIDFKMGDVNEWDSLGNFNLLLMVEERYGIRFTLQEMEAISSVRDLQEFLILKSIDVEVR
jgi:acyl carrier protein